ncbi:MAG TPA: helix-turn-helix domain-containing protein [Candidatus Angelobacter sp.]|nr:helix-turn-helix domain-containing protein [Candidatus Angelobacter sp.]
MKNELLTLPQLRQITGWSDRHIRRQASAGQIETRVDGGSKKFVAGSLPSQLQLRISRHKIKNDALALCGGSAVTPSSLSTEKVEIVALTPQGRQQAEQRLQIIQPLIDFIQHKHDGNLKSVIQRIAAEHGLSRSTIFDWRQRYKKGGFTALADRGRSDRGSSRFFDSHPEAAGFAINKYLNERLSIQLIHDALVREWNRLGNGERDNPPNYKTLRCFLQGLPEFIKVGSREPVREFNERFVPFLLRKIEAKRCNEYWISDHMLHDVWVRNDGVFGELETNEALRPWLTCITDMRSRKVVAAVWCSTPSSNSISSALRMAICKFGLPEKLYIDNGKDYQKVSKQIPGLSPEAGGVLYRLGVESHHCLPHHPQSKQIESFFRTLHQRFDVMYPTYAGKSPKHRPEQCEEALREHKRLLKLGKGDQSPLPPVSQFIEEANWWINGEFNATFPHSGQGMRRQTPDAVYESELPLESLQPVHPADVAELFWDRQRRTVGEGGCVRLFNAIYEPADADSRAAMIFQIETGSGEVLIACDPLNVGKAIAYDLHGKMLGWLTAQELLIHGETSQQQISQSMRLRRSMMREVKRYRAAIERSRTIAGDVTEIEALRQRAARKAKPEPHILALPAANAVNASPQRFHAAEIADQFISEGE